MTFLSKDNVKCNIAKPLIFSLFWLFQSFLFLVFYTFAVCFRDFLVKEVQQLFLFYSKHTWIHSVCLVDVLVMFLLKFENVKKTQLTWQRCNNRALQTCANLKASSPECAALSAQLKFLVITKMYFWKQQTTETRILI